MLIHRYFYFNPYRYIKKLQEAVKENDTKKSEDDAAKNEHQIKIIALKTTSNISALIRDLFHSPPIFRSVVQLSWIIKKTNVSTYTYKNGLIPKLKKNVGFPTHVQNLYCKCHTNAYNNPFVLLSFLLFSLK